MSQGFAQVGPPPTIIVQPLDQVVLRNGSVTFQVVAKSQTLMSYRWFKDGFLISGATASSYMIASAKTIDAGGYSVEVRNVSGAVLSRTARLTVLNANDTPVANNDAFSTSEDTPLTIPSAGILTNDIDLYPGGLSAILVTSVIQGSLLLNTNGSFTYLPNTNFNGSDNFTYRPTDGLTLGNVATVTINVTPINDLPIARDDTTNTLEDITRIINVLANDSEPDGTPLSISILSTTNGTVTISGTNAVFSPPTNFNGTSFFSYRISDGTYSATGSVTVLVGAVNDAPLAGNDVTNTLEDTSVTIEVLGNDSDVEGAPLKITGVLTTNGIAAINGTNIVFTPSKDFYGIARLSYTISDGTNSATAAVTVTVLSVNDAPPVASVDTYTTTQNVVLTITAPGILANDTDVDGDALSAWLVSSTSNGSLALNNDGSFSFRPNTNYVGSDSFAYYASDGSATGNVAIVTINVIPRNDPPLARNDSTNTLEDTSVIIAVLANDIDPEAGQFTIQSISTTNGSAVVSGDNVVFTPATNFNGTVVFAYTISDGTNLATGNVSVAVTPVYDAPIASNDITNTLEDTSVVIAVLANDYNPDRVLLSVNVISSPAAGVLTLSGTNFIFRPPTNYNGTVEFDYTIDDGSSLSTGRVTVTVIPVNDVPVARSESYATLENLPLTVPAAAGVLTNDTDVETASLSAVLVSGVRHGSLSLNPDGSFTYAPGSNYFGGDSFTYRASDGSANSALGTVSLFTTVTSRVTLVALGMVSNGFALQLVGPAPAAYTILASPDNVAWTPITTQMAWTGNLAFTDTEATNGARFYAATMGNQSTAILEQNTGNNSNEDLRPGRIGAQSFRHGTIGSPSYTISKIVLHLSRTATTPNTNLLISFGAVINGGTIAGSTVSINPSSITNSTSGNSFQAYEIFYPTPIGPFTGGTTYYLNLECEAPNGGRIFMESSGNAFSYGNGTYYRNGSNQGDDVRFEIWGQ